MGCAGVCVRVCVKVVKCMQNACLALRLHLALLWRGVCVCVCGSGMGSIRIMQLNVVNKMLTPLPLNLSTADVSTSEHN